MIGMKDGDKMKNILLLDVGGTEIKGSAADENGKILFDAKRFPSCSKENREQILENFCGIFRELSNLCDTAPAGIALAFPGDFDYRNGICLIKGIEKYESIYGVNLRGCFLEFAQSLGWCNNKSDFPIVFINDVEAFALGESENEKRLFALAIGTGAGSAFLIDGRPAPSGTFGVPENGWIYNTPFNGSQIDDWLSRRGIMKISEKYLGYSCDGKELADLCARNNKQALEAYNEFGSLLCYAAEPFITDFKPDAMSLGGQVTKSFSLFGKQLEELCSRHNVSLKITQETSISAFKGLYKAFYD